MSDNTCWAGDIERALWLSQQPWSSKQITLRWPRCKYCPSEMSWGFPTQCLRLAHPVQERKLMGSGVTRRPTEFLYVSLAQHQILTLKPSSHTNWSLVKEVSVTTLPWPLVHIGTDKAEIHQQLSLYHGYIFLLWFEMTFKSSSTWSEYKSTTQP